MSAGDSLPSSAVDSSAGPSHLVRIRPSREWDWPEFWEIWQFRQLLAFLAWRDIKVRYKQTVLGASWAILQPVLMMVIFCICFGRLAKLPSDGLPYQLFVYAGLLPWTFFAAAIINAGNSVVGSEKLITKIYFPRLLIPFASIGVAFVDLLIASSVLFALLLWHGVTPSTTMLLAPLMIFVIAAIAAGVGTLLAALNVAYRDFRYVLPFLVQLWLFATPSIYMSVDGADPQGFIAQCVYRVNPMTPLVAAFRDSMLGRSLEWPSLIYPTAIGLLLLFGGCFYFRRVEDRFADII